MVCGHQESWICNMDINATTYKARETSTPKACCHWPALLIGLTALLVGASEYVLSRDPDSSHIGRIAQHWVGNAAGAYQLFGPLGSWLPDFIHPFAFILITLAFLPDSSKVARYVVCLGWFAFNFLFEIGQLFGQTIAQWIASTLPQGKMTMALADYFACGTFHAGDLIAITFGSVAAYFLSIKIADRKMFKAYEDA